MWLRGYVALWLFCTLCASHGRWTPINFSGPGLRRPQLKENIVVALRATSRCLMPMVRPLQLGLLRDLHEAWTLPFSLLYLESKDHQGTPRANPESLKNRVGIRLCQDRPSREHWNSRITCSRRFWCLIEVKKTRYTDLKHSGTCFFMCYQAPALSNSQKNKNVHNRIYKMQTIWMQENLKI